MRGVFVRKYKKRSADLRKALEWWEDQQQNPDSAHTAASRRKIIFEDKNFSFKRRRSLCSSVTARSASKGKMFHPWKD